ncbi:glutamine synthetase family protein [Streptomyces sp. TRM 70351]|uniref:glutamine synthetase family protein n=1 Tax=Streptomyces sp. TRM 70351 TaxID=3116552 RepID=UPI002E7AE3C9|nr:glutamine synthetase family protein [Streptomyces sp. TRM 70351]MEE1930516.1 glutamine synthetase family protein [Streptomyces sp. TRM 70351]
MNAYEQLRADHAAGRVDNVIVALPDLQGRLQGSRLAVPHFLEEAADHGFSACTYLLATDVEMNTGPGYAIDAWSTGFGDFLLRPDPATYTTLPWDEGTALVIADATWPDGTPVPVAPRHVLRRQLDRLAAHGLTAHAGTELEFLAFDATYQQAHDANYHGLRPATRHNVDYALQGLTGLEPMLRRLRREMPRAGLTLETARAEVHPGQYEIVFRYAEAMTTADHHALFKHGTKQIAAQEGRAVTFMPKYDDGEGNSCHIHLSLRGEDGSAVLADPAADDGMSGLMRHFIAGQLACLPDFTLLMAPGVNSYKRLQPGAFAPTGIGWGRDNRTCPVRVIGSGHSLRIEHRVPGGDANPYLALAAVLAAGLHGIENRLPLPDPHPANALADPGVPRLPGTLTEALHHWEASDTVAKTFGDAVTTHYAQAARTELAAFERSVTDWERHRGFERL